MRIRQRITSRSSQTDIIVFDTFRDEVTGFSIAWLLTQIDNSYVKTAVFSAKEREGYPPVPKAVDLNTPSPRDIITSWKEKNVKTVAVSAAYKQVQITIQLLFDQHLCSFEYEKDKFNYALELAKKLDEKISQHFQTLSLQSESEVGSCIFSEYQCRFLKDGNTAVGITDAFLSLPDSIAKWYTFVCAEEGKNQTVLLTKSEKMSAEQILETLPNGKIQKIKIYMFWRGAGITVVIFPREQRIGLYTDKWLGSQKEDLIHLLNTNLYVYFFAT